MAKRFTDSRKWDDDWFFDLSNEDKLVWIYMLDKCDHAGIFKCNLRLLNFTLKSDYTLESLYDTFSNKIAKLRDNKYFIPSFIHFQYGELNDAVNCHKSVIASLKLERVNQQLIKGCLRVKDKNKDKVKDKDNIYKESFGEFVKLSSEQYQKLVDKMGKDSLKDLIQEMNRGIGAKGYKYLSHYHALLKWWKKAGEPKDVKY